MTRKELADAMRTGMRSPSVRESNSNYVSYDYRNGICLACALGCAYIGANGGDFHLAERRFNNARMNTDRVGSEILAGLLDITLELADEIELRHLDGDSILQIADWLEGK